MTRFSAASSAMVIMLLLSACGDLGDADGQVCSQYGDENCPCYENETCNLAPDGEPLRCEEGMCRRGCPKGEAGCLCLPDLECDAGLECRTIAGTPRCAGPCEPGEIGCPCLAARFCNTGADGVPLVCEEGSCSLPDCVPGTAGCVCDAYSTCGDGLVCDEGRCEVDTGQTLVPPENPRCYTPCRGGDLSGPDGSLLECSPEGLIEACVGDAVCIHGTCVAPEAAKKGSSTLPVTLPTCEDDCDCPDFQTCIDDTSGVGRCYSDCEASSDCNGERVCQRKVCRIHCQVDTEPCPEGSYCSTTNGLTGVCMPVCGPSQLSAALTSEVDYRVEPEDLALSTVNTVDSFTIVNDTAVWREFTVRKLRHTEYSDQGSRQELDDPLYWLTLSADGSDPVRDLEVTVGVDPDGGTATVEVGGAGGSDFARWQGVLEVSSPGLPQRSVRLAFVRSPEGQWSGKVYYFGNFGTAGLDQWLSELRAAGADREAAEGAAATSVQVVANALIRRWWAVRQGALTIDEFQAVLTATNTGAWRNASIKALCPSEDAPDPEAACYLYDNLVGHSLYTDSLSSSPIPSGVAELEVAMNLKAADSADPAAWTGRLVSELALQYPGNPRLDLRFERDPNECTRETGGTCVTLVDSFDADIALGGRYPTGPEDVDCSGRERFVAASTPWLVPGFKAGSVEDTQGRRHRYECRDRALPFGELAQRFAKNASLARANPVPDGRSLRRSLELVDGALFNQETLFLLFRERLPSFLAGDDAGFFAYGYMLLKRVPTDLEEDAYDSSPPVADPFPEPEVPGARCAGWLLDELSIAASEVNALNAQRIAYGALHGNPAGPNDNVLDPNGPEQVHYVCYDTGSFDTGPGAGVSCPPGSRVRFFTLPAGTDIVGDTCQQNGGICRAGEPCADSLWSCDNANADQGCQETGGCEVGKPCDRKGRCVARLEQWIREGKEGLRLDPEWSCEDDAVFCSEDRSDLREGKVFYAASAAGPPVFRRLDAEIEEAFRYRTRFRDRSGRAVGFAPAVCQGDSIPYCYDPEAIERILDRVECLGVVYAGWREFLSPAAAAELAGFLERSFSYVEEDRPGLATPYISFGFEHLYAELLTMMGQESYTASLAARFDLAGQRVADFDGTKFEPDGLVLAGGAGFEMRSLYQAVQYYQHALDRLYHLRGVLGTALAPEFQGQRIVTYRTAMSWFDKLITASAEKSRVWQAIAGRYLDLNRPNLARGVIERGYIQGYLESIFISQLMKRVLELADASARAQVALQIEQAQRTYRASLREMRNVFLDISDEVTLFGFPPDFIPFPPLDPGETSGFELVLERAMAKLEVAADKEEIALADTRDFDTDAASFQAALAQNELDTTTELANLCGWIRVPNAAGGEDVWPATAEFAHLDDDERARLLQDPCGLMGNGDLAEAFGEMDLLRVEIRSWRQAYDNLLMSIADEQARVNEQCQRIVDFKDLKLKVGGSIIAINALIGALGVINDTLDRVEGTISTATGISKCSVGTSPDCPAAAVSLGAYTGWSVAYHITRTITDSVIVLAELGISGLELYFESEEILQGCKELRIDGKYAIRDLMREVAQHRLDGLRIAYEVKLQASRIEKLRNDVTSWEATREAQRQLLVDVEAARNDPNIRIYKNDAVRNADRTFKAALKEAYKATRVFEYYTSQSYAALEDLLLVRMVTHGNFTLEAYLEELAEAFVEFEETYGIPDLRVDVLSMRDHVFSVPRTDTRGQPLTEEQRTALFRQRLGDPALLDERGYINVPFATDMDRLSPLTGNHKIRFIEVELTGEDMGDELGRVYLTPKGTGTVRALSGERLFYRFPDPTAVVDVFFNGERPLDDALGLFEGSTIDIYRNERLRDRPLVNTGWELVLNLRDEFVNEDIRVEALSDIRVFLWYNDFTEL